MSIFTCAQTHYPDLLVVYYPHLIDVLGNNYIYGIYNSIFLKKKRVSLLAEAILGGSSLETPFWGRGWVHDICAHYKHKRFGGRAEEYLLH